MKKITEATAVFLAAMCAAAFLEGTIGVGAHSGQGEPGPKEVQQSSTPLVLPLRFGTLTINGTCQQCEQRDRDEREFIAAFEADMKARKIPELPGVTR